KPRHWRSPRCLSKIPAVGDGTPRDFGLPYRPVMCGFWFRSPPAPDPPTGRSIKIVAYVLGGVVVTATITAIVALPQAGRFHAKGPPNTEHDALICSDCHKDALGTIRQQLQAKVQYWLGLRATYATFGHAPVANLSVRYAS